MEGNSLVFALKMSILVVTEKYGKNQRHSTSAYGIYYLPRKVMHVYI